MTDYDLAMSKRDLLLAQTSRSFADHPAFEATLALVESGECVCLACALTSGRQCHCANCYDPPSYQVTEAARTITRYQSFTMAQAPEADAAWRWQHNQFGRGNRWTSPVVALAGGMAAWGGEIFPSIADAQRALSYAALDFAGLAS
jgi:hypothetical protein